MNDSSSSTAKLNLPKYDLNNLESLKKITAQEIKDLAIRLEQDDYPTAFDGLADWHLLRAIAFNLPELIEPYRYLLDLEPFDEC
ncbi:MAG: DUF2555 domain-containing protein [Pseudanabaenaceae cyanobacterium bins.68]|nr:DUF2555 domain-containing protein [Pseudanabaenaceae cyanobacterium bins.68]